MLKKLVQVVNVVPVIAKADSLTIEERAAFKKRVRVYLFPNNIFYAVTNFSYLD